MYYLLKQTVLIFMWQKLGWRVWVVFHSLQLLPWHAFILLLKTNDLKRDHRFLFRTHDLERDVHFFTKASKRSLYLVLEQRFPFSQRQKRDVLYFMFYFRLWIGCGRQLCRCFGPNFFSNNDPVAVELFPKDLKYHWMHWLTSWVASSLFAYFQSVLRYLN